MTVCRYRPDTSARRTDRARWSGGTRRRDRRAAPWRLRKGVYGTRQRVTAATRRGRSGPRFWEIGLLTSDLLRTRPIALPCRPLPPGNGRAAADSCGREGMGRLRGPRSGSRRGGGVGSIGGRRSAPLGVMHDACHRGTAIRRHGMCMSGVQRVLTAAGNDPRTPRPERNQMRGEPDDPAAEPRRGS